MDSGASTAPVPPSRPSTQLRCAECHEAYIEEVEATAPPTPRTSAAPPSLPSLPSAPPPFSFPVPPLPFPFPSFPPFPFAGSPFLPFPAFPSAAAPQLFSSPGDYAVDSSHFQSLLSSFLQPLPSSAVQSSDPPLPPSVLSRLKEECVDDSTAASHPACAICQCDLAAGERVLSLSLSCQHRFHSDCVRPWLQRSSRCPTCRRRADGEDAQHAPTHARTAAAPTQTEGAAVSESTARH